MVIFPPYNKGGGYWVWLLIPLVLVGIYFLNPSFPEKQRSNMRANLAAQSQATPESQSNIWVAPDTASIPNSEEGDLIRYGRELIAHTALYLGPKGKVRAISNGMNCQNCHLDAGTVPYGNNYAVVATKYPTFRGRSGTVEDVPKRINDCLERSLHGQKLEENSLEMKAMTAYLNWVGGELDKEAEMIGIGLLKLEPLERAADPVQGKTVYLQHCATCHGPEGEGQLARDSSEWIYPPLFGPESYTTGAGLFRLSMFAAFIKSNMPYGVEFDNPILSDEEAWDIAAYVNSMPRPQKDFPQDWPNIASKPFDHPFGPYADTFSENQHKFGPFKEILRR